MDNIGNENIEAMLKEALVEGLPEDPTENIDSNQKNDNVTQDSADSKETTGEASGTNQQIDEDLLKNRNEILERTAQEKEQEIVAKKREEELKSQEVAKEEEVRVPEDIKSAVEKILADKEMAQKAELDKVEKVNNMLNDYLTKNPDDAKLSNDIKKVMESHPTLTPKAAAILARQLNPSAQNLTVGDRSNPSLRDSEKPLDRMSLSELRNSSEVKDALKSIGL